MAVTATNTQASDSPESAKTTRPVTPIDRLREAFDRLSNKQKILLMGAVAAIVALIVVSMLVLKPPQYRVLFSNISERDGGSIIAALEQMNISYKFSDTGDAILIPTDKVHEVRLRLASQGLPKGGNVGFELMENQKLGVSQFAEQINYQRGLEGELSKTIESIGTVRSARVHLAMPKPTVFVREELKPSASVMLSLYPGRMLEPIQIAGIQNLVAASVPNLSPTSVTLIDQSGAMISQLRSRLLDAGLDPSQVKFIQEIEANIVKRINDILEPIVGPGNAKAQVAADIDFSQIEQTAETFRPNTTPPDISIRSQQTSESASATPTPALGVPGALTNQPPVPPTAPLTQPPVAGAAPAAAVQPPLGATIPGQVNAAGVQAPITSVAQPLSTRKDSTTNFEVDRTVKHVKSSVGTIKRLSAAVVVNNRKDSAAKTGIRPLTEQEVKQITDLVRDAMGFSQDRGDTISVVNTAFSEVEKDLTPIPFWKDPEIMPSGKEIAVYTIATLLLLYILIGIIRPLIKTMLPPPVAPTVAREYAEGEGEGEGGETDMAETIDGMGGFYTPPAVLTLEKMLEEAREFTLKDPRVAANIIKEWMGTNAN